MFTAVAKINFNDMTEAIPAFITLIFMPFTYSIAQGIVFGIISYCLLKIFTGRFKDITVTVYVMTALFLVKLVLDSIHIFQK